MTTTLRAAADDLYRALVSEHGHSERDGAPWPACLPVHIAMNRYRDAIEAPMPPANFGEQVISEGGLPRDLQARVDAIGRGD